MGINLVEYQLEIVEAIYTRQYEHVVITSATQAGKSYAVAVAIVLFAVMNKKEKVVLIAPTREQSKIIMRYILEIFSQNPILGCMLDISTKETADKLKHEMRKTMIRLNNDTYIQILTAEGGLLGFSATLLILDESAEIDDEVYRTQIRRMLGADEGVKKILVEISTPHKRNHFFESFSSPTAKVIQVNWQRAVKAGRLRPEFVKEQEEILMPDEFKMWYGAEFIDEGKHQMYPYSFVERAQVIYSNQPKQTYKKILIGIDIARYGIDSTVYTIVGYDEEKDYYQILDIQNHEKMSLAHTMGKAINLIEEYKPEVVGVDDIGIGGGVTDQLKDLGYNVVPFIAGKQPLDTKRFANVKAEAHMFVRNLMEKNKLGIPKNRFLIRDLTTIEKEFTADGKNRIVDPEKSPDYADSLIYAIYCNQLQERVMFINMGY